MIEVLTGIACDLSVLFTLHIFCRLRPTAMANSKLWGKYLNE